MTHTRPNPLARRRRRPGGYTLIEILIVVGIIVLMVGIALPAFRTITGGRSEQGATNQIVSLLARARADAIGTQQPRGVAVYTDTAGQCRLAEVGPVPFTPWTTAANLYNASTNPAPPAFAKGACVVYSGVYYVCIKAVLSTDLVDLSQGPKDPAVLLHWHNFVNNSTNAHEGYWATQWASSTPILYDQLADTDPIVLPLGVGVQVNADDNAAGVHGTSDRYLHAGFLMFDAGGRLTYQTQAMSQYGLVGSAVGYDVAINATTTPPLPAVTPAVTASQPLPSSFGLVVYDREAFTNQNFPAHDPTFDAAVSYTGTSPSAKDEETWLDLNATPVLVNRYTGELVRGE